MSASEQQLRGETPSRDAPLGLQTPTPGGSGHDMTEVRRPTLETSYATPTPASSTSAPLTFANSVSNRSSAPSASSQQAADGETDDGTRVSAYARLDFESFTFYVQTLQVILGRRAENGSNMVDVHLGPAKAISRRHAKIFYNFATQRFELTVIGRNGAFVGDAFVETGSTVPLWDSTRVQIGQITFTFVLPSMPAPVEGVEMPQESLPEYGTDGEATTAPSSRAASGSPAPRKKREDIKLETGDENNFFAVTAAEQAALTGPGATSRRKPRKEYKPEEIPPEYRTKPAFSYSHLIATALRERAPQSGLSLADIYEGIMDIFPFYRYSQPGWQNSVRHNLSSSKAFRKVSKEGKGWLWGLNEEYLAEKELQKKKAEAKQARARANNEHSSTNALGHEKTIAQLAQEIPHREFTSVGQPKAIDASGRAGINQDTVKLLATLQQKLTAQLAAAGQPAINRQLLTNSLAIVIAQTAKASGGINNIGNVLQNPQAIQRLMVQALEIMKKQAQQNRGPSPDDNTGNVSSNAILPAQSQTAQAAQAQDVQAALSNSTTMKSVVQAVNDAAVESGVVASSESTSDANGGPQVSAPIGAIDVTMSTSAPAPLLAASSNSAPVPVRAPSSGSTVAHTPAGSTPAASPHSQAASSSTAKPTMTLEKIQELLAQAEKIANPSPSILAAIEQLKAHRRSMELKRPHESVEPPSKRSA